MKTFLKWLAGVITVFILLILFIIITLNIVFDTEPYIPDYAYVEINLQGHLPEYIPPDAFESALGQTRFDMAKFRDVLEKAAIDERIAGVVLKIGYLQVSLGEAQELTDLIKKFRDSGKKIVAFLGPGLTTTRDYYVASACESVFMTPQANLFLTGLYSEVTFYKDFFSKIGVEADFIHIGDYKNAPDPYTRSTMSPEQREETTQLLDAWYNDIRQTIAANRGFSSEKVDELINIKTGFTGWEAWREGLVDTVLYYPEVVKYFPSENGLPEPLSAEEYTTVPAGDLDIRKDSKIAVVHCLGTITGGSNSEDYLMGQLAGAASFADNMEKAAESSAIKAIILRIDSPGGSASASEVMWNAVKKAVEKKPVIVSISGMCASGGYYIAAPAITIISQKNSIVGSIGIFGGKFSIGALYKKLGMNTEKITRGKNAAIFSLSQVWSESEKKVIRHILEEFYSDFKIKVAEGRGIPFDSVEALAGGRIFTGGTALHNKLVDRHGNFYDAVDEAKRLAGIEEKESVELIYYPASKSLLGEILSGIQAKNASENILLDSYERLEQTLLFWQNQPLALLPFRLEYLP
ncbi:MAG: signal peptide peptidase SppA [Calditrichaceae bacterium]|nr:signal peptide peptidase SppA [Calditrichaceae bacterium]RQV96457.1 MAG: signal peptide peptidase SppA [Calditrichota bacterium]